MTKKSACFANQLTFANYGSMRRSLVLLPPSCDAGPSCSKGSLGYSTDTLLSSGSVLAKGSALHIEKIQWIALSTLSNNWGLVYHTLHLMGLSENLLVPINHPSGESFQQNLLMASAKMGPK